MKMSAIMAIPRNRYPKKIIYVTPSSTGFNKVVPGSNTKLKIKTIQIFF
jgi:hypothetical protein